MSVIDPVPSVEPRDSLPRRVLRGETTYDFYGRRWWGFGFSIFLLVVTAVSIGTQGLELGIDFRGGVSWEVPAEELTEAGARDVLVSNGIDPNTAKVQTLSGANETRLRIQAGDQSEEVRLAVRDGLASAAGVDASDVSVANVSSSWGRSITEKAIRALIVFFVIVAAFIAWRFEWKMAVSGLLATLHDVAITVGIYSLFGFEITPATLVAFLTILGYSLYDTIVVFDKVKENTARFAGSRVAYADIVNVSMNQVLMRTINTTISSLLPVVSLLVIGSMVLGAVSLQEFALALLIGLLVGGYSSLFVASPLLAILKEREPKYRSLRGDHATGEAMRQLALHGAGALRREQVRPSIVASGVAHTVDGEASTPGTAEATVLLTHPPRPRKKRRR
jgi:preprotein translocase subunit SecF